MKRILLLALALMAATSAYGMDFDDDGGDDGNWTPEQHREWCRQHPEHPKCKHDDRGRDDRGGRGDRGRGGKRGGRDNRGRGTLNKLFGGDRGHGGERGGRR